jgi:hypothetical protein
VKEKKCGTCIYFEQIGCSTDGWCKRNVKEFYNFFHSQLEKGYLKVCMYDKNDCCVM